MLPALQILTFWLDFQRNWYAINENFEADGHDAP